MRTGYTHAYRTVIFCALSMSAACSPGYVVRAAYEQGKILSAREPIETILTSDRISSDEREKLIVVSSARAHAISLGLTPGRAFTYFTRLDRDVLAWVVIGCRQDAFSPYTWWFPFVGTVPYKGFFDHEDAVAEAQTLQTKGFETSVRPTEAISTLGWFDDPVLSTTLKHDISDIANTVIHESVHSTIWVPGSVPFNETLANFVGTAGAIDLFVRQQAECRTAAIPASRCTAVDEALAATRARALRATHLSLMLTALYDDLEQLYKSSHSSAEKISERVQIFQRHLGPFRVLYPNLNILTSINNAELLQLKFYYTHYERFAALFEKCASSWPDFLKRIKAIAAKAKSNSTDPFIELEDELRS